MHDRDGVALSGNQRCGRTHHQRCASLVFVFTQAIGDRGGARLELEEGLSLAGTAGLKTGS
jgi:hypothetical protein